LFYHIKKELKKIVSDDMKIYQEFSAHFMNFGSKLTDNVIRLQKNNTISRRDVERNTFSIFMYPVDYEIMIYT